MPLHPEFGTRPNVYYLPPLSPNRLNDDMSEAPDSPRIPPDYLESLFGSDVRAALEILRNEMTRVRDGGASELLRTLIAYRWQELLGPFAEDPARIIAAG